jgi:hypothetical protein
VFSDVKFKIVEQCFNYCSKICGIFFQKKSDQSCQFINLERQRGPKTTIIQNILSKAEPKLFTHRVTPGDHKWLGGIRKQQPRQQPDRKRIPCSSGYQRRDRVGTLKNNCKNK